jgi:hypothetical protein
MEGYSRKDIFEFVGMVAIVLSLAIVAFEVRQNTAAVRSAAVQAVSDQSTDAISLVVENADLRDALDAADEGIADQKQLRQVNTFYALLLRVQINRFLQSEVGAIDKQVILKMGGRATVYSTPSFRNYWDSIKGNQPDDFREFMESEVILQDIAGTKFTPN